MKLGEPSNTKGAPPAFSEFVKYKKSESEEAVVSSMLTVSLTIIVLLYKFLIVACPSDHALGLNFATSELYSL